MTVSFLHLRYATGSVDLQREGESSPKSWIPCKSHLCAILDTGSDWGKRTGFNGRRILVVTTDLLHQTWQWHIARE
jgi:hypothetical protein